MNRLRPFIFATFATTLIWLGFVPQFAVAQISIAEIKRDAPVSFEDEILPILRRNCLACHSASEGYGGLVLESPANMVEGGDSGAAIVSGKGAESLLLKLAAHNGEPVMPPPDNDVAAKNLTPQELGLLKLWIDQGARSTGLGGLLSPQDWRPLPPGPNPIYAVATTADGQFAACGRANQIFIYHVPTGRLVTRLTDPKLQAESRDGRPGIAHLDIVQSLAFSPQGDRLASGGFRTAKIWRYPRDVQRYQFAATNSVTAIAVDRHRRWIATGGAGHTIKLWSVETGDAGPVLEGHTGPITGLCFSRDGERLYSSSEDATIRSWDIAEGSLLGHIVAPDAVTALTSIWRHDETPDPSPSTSTLAADASDGSSPSDAVSEKEALPSGQEFLVSGTGNSLLLWNPPEPMPELSADVLPEVEWLVADRTRRFVALANAVGAVQVWDMDTRAIVGAWDTDEPNLASIALASVASSPDPMAAQAQDAGTESPDVGATGENPPSVRLQLATATTEGRVKVWDVESGEPEMQWRASLGAVTSLAFNADGRTLATGDDQGRISEWELGSSNNELAPIAEVSTRTMVSSRDGSRLATVESIGGKTAIVVRELESGKVLATLLGHQGPVLSLAFNNDATKLVSGGEDSTARVWNLADAKFPEIAVFVGHAAGVSAVAFNGASDQVVSGALDGSLKLWNVADTTELHALAGHTGAITGVAMLQGTSPVSSSTDKTIRFWNPADGKVIRSLTEPAAVSAFAANSDSSRLAVAVGTDTKIYQTSDGKLLHTLLGLSVPANQLSFSTDNERVAASSVTADASEVAVYQVADGRLLEMVTIDALQTAAIAGNGSELLVADSTAIRHHPLHFERLWPAAAQPVTSLIYRSDSGVLFTASLDGTVRGFNLQSGQPLFSANHGNAVNDLSLSPDEQTLASAGQTEVKLFNATNGAPVQPTQLQPASGPIESVAFTADGKRLVVASAVSAAKPMTESRQITIFARTDGVAEQVLPPNAEESLRASQVVVAGDDRRVLALSSTGDLTQWRLNIENHFAGHSQPVSCLAEVEVTQAGSLQVLSGSLDGTVRHWDLAATTPLLRQMNHGAPVSGVAAHREAGRFASVSENHNVRLWNAENGQQLAEMKGDLRAKEAVAAWTLRKTDWTAKVATSKTQLEAAQKEVPVKTEAEKTAATALASAETEAKAKEAEWMKAKTAKLAAEKSAIEAAAAAQTAALSMTEANDKALLLAARVARANERATQATTIAQGNTGNEQLDQIAKEAAAELAELQKLAQAAEAAKADPAKKATAAAKLADEAAQKVTQATKPFTDATTALETAQKNLTAATQMHDLAVRDLKLAKEALTAGQQKLANAEKVLGEVEGKLAEAVAAEQAAQQPLRCVDFAPDGKTLATGGDLGIVHTWGADSGNPIASYEGHGGSIQTLAFLDANQLVSGGLDKQAILWEVNPAWELERTIGSLQDPTTLIDRVVAVDFSQDGRLLATGGGVPSRSGEVKIWEVESGSLLHAMQDAHTDSVNAVAFSHDDAFLASAASDKLIKKWDVASGEMVNQFEGHTGHVLGVAWRSNGQMLVSSGGDATVRIWNAVNGDRIRTIQGYNKQVTDVCFVGQTQFVVAVSGDPIVRMHNSDNGGTQRNFGGSADYMYAIDATPDSSVVVAGGHDGVLRIWNGANAQVLHSLAPPQPTVEPSSP